MLNKYFTKNKFTVLTIVIFILFVSISIVDSVYAVERTITSNDDLKATVDELSGNNRVTINLRPGNYDLSNKNITIKGHVTINGLGTGNSRPVLDAKQTNRHFTVTEGSTLTLKNLIITNGKAAYEKTIDYSDFGGAIYSREGTLTIENCVFSNNEAESIGGAIYSYDSNVYITKSYFDKNQATEGGAIMFSNSGGFLFSLFHQTSNKKLTINDCHFTENTATRSFGGAIDSSCGIVNINNCIFTKNTAQEAGAIYSYRDEISIISSTFKENSARANSGAIDFSSGVTRPLSKATINKCTFIKNVANKSIGGGAIGSGVDLSIFNSVFSQNKANPQHGMGGAISGGFSKIDNSIFYKNSANHGGAVYTAFPNAPITRSIFYKNSVKTNGSAFYYVDQKWGQNKPVSTFSKNVFYGNKGRYVIYKPKQNPSKINANNNYWGKNMNLKKVNASCYGVNISKIATSPRVRTR